MPPVQVFMHLEPNLTIEVILNKQYWKTDTKMEHNNLNIENMMKYFAKNQNNMKII